MAGRCTVRRCRDERAGGGDTRESISYTQQSLAGRIPSRQASLLAVYAAQLPAKYGINTFPAWGLRKPGLPKPVT